MRRLIQAGTGAALALAVASCRGPSDADGDGGPYHFVPGREPSVEAEPAAGSGRLSADGAVRFAVMGDTRGGGKEANLLAWQLARMADSQGLDAVLLNGDNLESSGLSLKGVDISFRRPFAPLLSRGIPVYAVLGNHDVAFGDASWEINLPDFHMAGQRYQAVNIGGLADVFLIDSTIIKKRPEGDGERAWLAAALDASRAPWRVAVIHHPIFGASGDGEPSPGRRVVLAPMFEEHHVDLVFQGHQHVYMRMDPQGGVRYFTVGASSMVHRGSVEFAPPVALGDTRHTVAMIWEIRGDSARFQTITSDGAVIDKGEVDR